MDRVLRLLESILFCCLAALILFWIADRLRGLDFEPFPVTPCIGTACTPYTGPYQDSPWAVFSRALDARGVVSFSDTNICAHLAQTLQSRGEAAEGVANIIELITQRGTVAVSRPDDGVVLMSPGPRNDGFSDVLRDAIRMGGSRGCHPINYQPVFWPLWTGWMLLANLRLFRGRQKVWAAR